LYRSCELSALRHTRCKKEFQKALLQPISPEKLRACATAGFTRGRNAFAFAGNASVRRISLEMTNHTPAARAWRAPTVTIRNYLILLIFL
jgi:hypothetical protein